MKELTCAPSLKLEKLTKKKTCRAENVLHKRTLHICSIFSTITSDTY